MIPDELPYITDKNKYFQIEYSLGTNKYTVHFLDKIIENADYAYFKHSTSKHVIIRNNGKYTLCDIYGIPEKHAQDVDCIRYFNDDFYRVNKGKKYYTRYGKIKRGVALVTTLAIIGCLVKCRNDNIRTQAALDKMPATYLHLNKNQAFFDTDGDKTTAEMSAIMKNASIAKNATTEDNTSIQAGETHLISEWKGKGFYSFRHVKQNNQKIR